MTDRHIILRNDKLKATAAEAVLNCPDSPLHEIVIREHVKNRTIGQNSRHWATLNEYLRQMNLTVELISNSIGV
jgi:hypothetical protein